METRTERRSLRKRLAWAGMAAVVLLAAAFAVVLAGTGGHPRRAIRWLWGGPIVVGAGLATDYETLAEALEHASAGQRILVLPGRYEGRLVVLREVEIVGAGPAGSVVLQYSHGAALVLRVPATVRNLTLRCTAPPPAKHHALYVMSRAAVVEDCDIASTSLASVCVAGQTTEAILRRCRIHGSPQTGALVYDGALVALEECEVDGNGFAGVEVRGGAQAVLRDCRLHGGQQSGILTSDGAEAQLERCDVYQHRLTGMTAGGGSRVTASGCRFRENGQAGVVVQTQAQAAFDDCEFADNRHAGVDYRTGARVTVVRSRMVRNRDGAAGMIGGSGTFDHCEIADNRSHNILAQYRSDIVLRDCQARDAGEHGMALFERARARLERCTVTGSTRVQALVQDSTAALQQCALRDGRDLGLQVSGGTVTFEGGSLAGNGAPGAVVGPGGRLTLRGALIEANAYLGVSSQAGRVTLEECTVRDNGDCGLAVTTGGRLTARRTRVSSHEQNAAAASEGGLLTLQECELCGAGWCGAWVGEGARAVLEDCTIQDNAYMGVCVEDGGAVQAERSRLRGNRWYAVKLMGAARADVEGCDLTGNFRGPWQLDFTVDLVERDNLQ